MIMDILKGLLNSSSSAKCLEDLPELYMSEQTRKEREKQIRTMYLEYQAFTEISDTPMYNLYFRPQRGLELASVKYVNDEGYNLYVSDTLLNQPNMKEVLFHEFTHIYDKEYLDKVYAYRKDGKNDCRKTHVYTEIHAEQVKFIYMLGCKKITDIPDGANQNSDVYTLDGKRTTFFKCLLEFKSLMEERYVRESKKIKNNTIHIRSIENMASQISYYIGALTVYQKYCDYRVDELKDLNIISDFWNIDIRKIIEFYCNHDIHKPTMKTLPKIEIAEIGNILMCDLPNSARERYTVIEETRRN